MINKFKKDNGSTLALVLIIMLVLSILGGAVINLSVGEVKFAKGQEDKVQAYYVARSGAQSVAEYMILDPSNTKNIIGQTTTVATTVMPGGSFMVSVAQNPSNANSIIITSTGTYKNATQTAKIELSKTPSGIGGIFQHAIVGISGISIKGASGSGLDINGSVATITGTIDLGIHGKATDEIVDGTLTYPPIVLPENRTPAVAYTETAIGNLNTSMTFTTVAGTPKYVKVGSIDLKNDDITIAGDGVLHMYVNGDITLDTKASFAVNSKAKLYIYVTGARTISFGGKGATNNLMIYAPDSTITWENAQPHASFKGALIAKNVILANQVTITYDSTLVNDVDLDTTGTGVTYSGYKYID